jgi:hypothetical protein
VLGALSGKVPARVARNLGVGVQSTPGGFPSESAKIKESRAFQRFRETVKCSRGAKSRQPSDASGKPREPGDKRKVCSTTFLQAGLTALDQFYWQREKS